MKQRGSIRKSLLVALVLMPFLVTFADLVVPLGVSQEGAALGEYVMLVVGCALLLLLPFRYMGVSALLAVAPVCVLLLYVVVISLVHDNGLVWGLSGRLLLISVVILTSAELARRSVLQTSTVAFLAVSILTLTWLSQALGVLLGRTAYVDWGVDAAVGLGSASATGAALSVGAAGVLWKGDRLRDGGWLLLAMLAAIASLRRTAMLAVGCVIALRMRLSRIGEGRAPRVVTVGFTAVLFGVAAVWTLTGTELGQAALMRWEAAALGSHGSPRPREVLWRDALNMLRGSSTVEVLFGIGPAALTRRLGQDPHNGVLYFLIAFGVAGTLLYMSIFVTVLRAAWRLRLHDRSLTHAAFANWLVLLLWAITSNTGLSPVFWLCFVIFGVSVGLPARRQVDRNVTYIT